jgi:histidinol dehydrogenase
MRVRRFEWEEAALTAARMRGWSSETPEEVDVTDIWHHVAGRGDEAVVELTNRFDATERPISIEDLRVSEKAIAAALAELEPNLREAMDAAVLNIRKVSEAQVESEQASRPQLGPERVQPRTTSLSQGHEVRVREVPVTAAGIYAPGGRGVYPSTVLMCCISAQVAGVARIALASPPGPDGEVNRQVLAAAGLCGVDEVYAMGGAQAVFALAEGTQTIERVDIVVGPGNPWVQKAKLLMSSYGRVGIDSLAGPSELMLVAGHDTDPEWAALDLCAQAEHGPDSPLVAVAVEEHVLGAIAAATEKAAAERPGVEDAPLALVQVPDLSDAIDLANAFAPEHLELLEEDAALLAKGVTTAGCVFVGRYGATAFGDYVAGSNHVLPTGGTGRFSGPLGPGVFRRRIATVEIPADAAEKLAPQVETLARAEGFPVHGESAMIRAKDAQRESRR